MVFGRQGSAAFIEWVGSFYVLTLNQVLHNLIVRNKLLRYAAPWAEGSFKKILKFSNKGDRGLYSCNKFNNLPPEYVWDEYPSTISTLPYTWNNDVLETKKILMH